MDKRWELKPTPIDPVALECLELVRSLQLATLRYLMIPKEYFQHGTKGVTDGHHKRVGDNPRKEEPPS